MADGPLGPSLQSGVAYHSLGFEDENLASFLGWWAATVATNCPSRLVNYPNSYLQNLANDRPLRPVDALWTVYNNMLLIQTSFATKLWQNNTSFAG